MVALLVENFAAAKHCMRAAVGSTHFHHTNVISIAYLFMVVAIKIYINKLK